MRARQRKKNYKKIHGFNPPKTLDCIFDTNSIAEVAGKMVPVFKKWVNSLFETIKNMEKNIKEMSEEEFNEKILCWELTTEQISIAKMIRYGRKKNQ